MRTIDVALSADLNDRVKETRTWSQSKIHILVFVFGANQEN